MVSMGYMCVVFLWFFRLNDYQNEIEQNQLTITTTTTTTKTLLVCFET